MAIQGFCPPPSPSPPSHSHSPYYQLLECGSARLGRVKKVIRFFKELICIKSKYAFSAILKPFRSMKRGEAELHTLQY